MPAERSLSISDRSIGDRISAPRNNPSGATRHRRAEHGLEKCVHSCKQGGCKNRQGSLWWAREGSSCGRHAVSRKKHPDCHPRCPGFEFLGDKSGRPTVPVNPLLLMCPSWVFPVVSPGSSLNLPIVLFIADPTRETSYDRAAVVDLNFTEITNDQHDYDFFTHPITMELPNLVKSFPSFIWTKTENEQQSILYLDWLQIPARLRVTHNLEVILMTHESLLRAMEDNLENPEGEILRRADLILGGVDYTIDYTVQYGMSPVQLNQYEQIVRLLEASGKQFWPNQWQSRLYGQKKPLMLHLDAIAHRRGEKRPLTKNIPISETYSPDDFPGYVFKRGFSDCGRHVVFPNDRSKLDLEQVKRHRVDWMAQEYIETLKVYGELRVLCIDTEPLEIVWTRDNTEYSGEDGAPYRCTQVNTIAPFTILGSISPDRIVNSDGFDYTVHEGNQTIITFKHWVREVLHELIVEEEAQNKWRSSLRDMCRVDVGFIKDDNGLFQPFVHEVERERNTTFFSSVFDAHRANGVWAALAQVISNFAHAYKQV